MKWNTKWWPPCAIPFPPKLRMCCSLQSDGPRNTKVGARVRVVCRCLTPGRPVLPASAWWPLQIRKYGRWPLYNMYWTLIRHVHVGFILKQDLVPSYLTKLKTETNICTEAKFDGNIGILVPLCVTKPELQTAVFYRMLSCEFSSNRGNVC